MGFERLPGDMFYDFCDSGVAEGADWVPEWLPNQKENQAIPGCQSGAFWQWVALGMFLKCFDAIWRYWEEARYRLFSNMVCIDS